MINYKEQYLLNLLEKNKDINIKSESFLSQEKIFNDCFQMLNKKLMEKKINFKQLSQIENAMYCSYYQLIDCIIQDEHIKFIF